MPTQSVSQNTVINVGSDGTYYIEVPSTGIKFEGYTKDMGDKGWVVAPFRVPLYATTKDNMVDKGRSMSVTHVSLGKKAISDFPVSGECVWVLSDDPHFQVSLFTKPFASGGQSGLFTLSDGRGENLSKDFQFFSRVGLSIPHRQGSLCRREIGRWLSEHNLALINEAATKAGGGSYTDYKLLSVEQDPDEVDRSGLVLWRFNFQLIGGSEGSGKQGSSSMKEKLKKVFHLGGESSK